MSEFKFNRGQGKCAITGREFADGEKYIVALRPEGEQEGVFTRVDICMEAWERQGDAGYTAWWPTEFSTRRKQPLMDPDLLWQVFHRARATEQPADNTFSRDELDGFAFVAALGLMRLKKLKLKGTRRAGKREVMIFETPGRAAQRETYEVSNPSLTEEQQMQVEERLADLV
jgi:hypothetical protein